MTVKYTFWVLVFYFETNLIKVVACWVKKCSGLQSEIDIIVLPREMYLWFDKIIFWIMLYRAFAFVLHVKVEVWKYMYAFVVCQAARSHKDILCTPPLAYDWKMVKSDIKAHSLTPLLLRPIDYKQWPLTCADVIFVGHLCFLQVGMSQRGKDVLVTWLSLVAFSLGNLIRKLSMLYMYILWYDL